MHELGLCYSYLRTCCFTFTLAEDAFDQGYNRDGTRTSSSVPPQHASHISGPSSVRSTAPLGSHPQSLSAPSMDQTHTTQKHSDPDGSAQESYAQHERQFSCASLEHSLQELDRNLQDMLMESGEDKGSKSHVAEWLRQTSEEAPSPEDRVDREFQVASPASTDNSFIYSTVSL